MIRRGPLRFPCCLFSGAKRCVCPFARTSSVHVRKRCYGTAVGSVSAGSRSVERSRARRGRAEWGSISRERIVDVATKVVRRGDYEQLTIRNLAAELGVSPMSLYGHVRGKEDLLDEVVDKLLCEVWRPRAKEENWRAWIAEAADRLRRFLVRQPAALHVYLQHPVVSPSAVTRMNVMMRILKNAGLDELTARRAYGTIHTYTIGFAALEASRTRAGHSLVGATKLVRQLSSFTSSGQFLAGLDYILDGVLLGCRNELRTQNSLIGGPEC